MANLKVNTPYGEFTRSTKTAYTHAVVRTCARAMDTLARKDERGMNSRVIGRWIKDRGYAVTWHGSEVAARSAAAKPYGWADSIVVGIFPVEA